MPVGYEFPWWSLGIIIFFAAAAFAWVFYSFVILPAIFMISYRFSKPVYEEENKCPNCGEYECDSCWINL